jgi:hypothetical protein
MTVETYLTVDGVECVAWTDEQGEHSMTREAYTAWLEAQTPKTTSKAAAN